MGRERFGDVSAPIAVPPYFLRSAPLAPGPHRHDLLLPTREDSWAALQPCRSDGSPFARVEEKHGNGRLWEDRCHSPSALSKVAGAPSRSRSRRLTASGARGSISRVSSARRCRKRDGTPAILFLLPGRYSFPSGSWLVTMIVIESTIFEVVGTVAESKTSLRFCTSLRRDGGYSAITPRRTRRGLSFLERLPSPPGLPVSSSRRPRKRALVGSWRLAFRIPSRSRRASAR